MSGKWTYYEPYSYEGLDITCTCPEGTNLISLGIIPCPAADAIYAFGSSKDDADKAHAEAEQLTKLGRHKQAKEQHERGRQHDLAAGIHLGRAYTRGVTCRAQRPTSATADTP